MMNTKTKNFEETTKSCHVFNEEVKEWLSITVHSCSEPKDPTDAECIDDGIQPEDSISNISSRKASHIKSRASGVSKSSATSTVRINAEAIKAALFKRSEALKQKPRIEAQEERLRRENGQLELKTDLAATTAKILVLEMNSLQCVSARSDGINSYLERSKAQRSICLDPQGNAFIPYGDDVLAAPDPALVVGPKQRSAAHMDGLTKAPH